VSEAPVLFPPVITQANCSAVGMTERQFLDFCRAHGELVAPIGKLRAVPTEDLVRYLRSARSESRTDIESVDAVLSLVGRQRRAG
jgi:hypothetical protein